MGFPKLKKRQKKKPDAGGRAANSRDENSLIFFPHIKMIVKKQGLARLLSRKKDWMIYQTE